VWEGGELNFGDPLGRGDDDRLGWWCGLGVESKVGVWGGGGGVGGWVNAI